MEGEAVVSRSPGACDCDARSPPPSPRHWGPTTPAKIPSGLRQVLFLAFSWVRGAGGRAGGGSRRAKGGWPAPPPPFFFAAGDRAPPPPLLPRPPPRPADPRAAFQASLGVVGPPWSEGEWPGLAADGGRWRRVLALLSRPHISAHASRPPGTTQPPLALHALTSRPRPRSRSPLALTCLPPHSAAAMRPTLAPCVPPSRSRVRPPRSPTLVHSRPPGPSAASGRLTTHDALSYLREVKQRFANNKGVYDTFLIIMKEFKAQKCVGWFGAGAGTCARGSGGSGLRQNGNSPRARARAP